MLTMLKNKPIRSMLSLSFVALLPLSSLSAAESKTGEELYQRCAACHLDSGKGVASMFPPLTGRLGALNNTQLGRDYLVMVVEAGLVGSIQVEGSRYQGFMPAQGLGMQDKDIASVLNYLLASFNAESLKENWSEFTGAEISAIKARYPAMSSQGVHTLRQSAFNAK